MYSISKEEVEKAKESVAKGFNRSLLTNLHKFSKYYFPNLDEARLTETLIDGLATGESVRTATSKRLTAAFCNLYGTYVGSLAIADAIKDRTIIETPSNNFTNIEAKGLKSCPSVSSYVQEKFNEYLEKFMSMNTGSLNFETANKFTGMYFASLRSRLENEISRYEEVKSLGNVNVGDLALNGLDVVKDDDLPEMYFSSLTGNDEIKRNLSLNSTRLVCESGPINSVILYGEPGTGKTSLVYAAANYIKNAERFKHSRNPFRFMKIRVTDIFDKFVGQSAKNLEGLLQTVSDPDHTTIALIDDGDSYFSNREKQGKEVDSHTLNILFEFLDKKAPNYTLFITTNFYDAFDPAIKSKVGLKLEVKRPETLDEYAAILQAKIKTSLPKEFKKYAVSTEDYRLIASKAKELKLSPRDIEKIAEGISQRVASARNDTIRDYCTFGDEEVVINPSKNYRELTKSVLEEAIAGHIHVQKKSEEDSIKREVEQRKRKIEVEKELMNGVAA